MILWIRVFFFLKGIVWFGFYLNSIEFKMKVNLVFLFELFGGRCYLIFWIIMGRGFSYFLELMRRLYEGIVSFFFIYFV